MAGTLYALRDTLEVLAPVCYFFHTFPLIILFLSHSLLYSEQHVASIGEPSMIAVSPDGSRLALLYPSGTLV